MAKTHPRRSRLVLAAAAATILAAAPASAPAAVPFRIAHALGAACSVKPTYGWPLRPFDRPHAVRALFGDPRIPDSYRHGSHSFHTGIDIVAADGTPVYSPVTGTVFLDPRHPLVVWVGELRRHVFGFWHVIPSVTEGSVAIADHTVIGHVAAPWGHVHFTEAVNGQLVNPLRPGALGPYTDDVAPRITELEAQRGNTPVDVADASGRVELVAEVADGLSLPVAPPWHDMPVMPALVRWRLVGPHRVVAPWTTALDFRLTIPRASELTRTYAAWTRQNHPRHPGRYRVFLGRGIDTRAVPDGTYTVQVLAGDTCGNRTTASFALGIDNAASPPGVPLHHQSSAASLAITRSMW
jgi:murein DD-endopeptidase MepM/ murein hydrolase activator NlpD